MYLSIHYLRALAALSILVLHAGTYYGTEHLKLAIGVDVFFVISGFVMMVTLEGSPTPSAFLRSRALRVLPLYWVVLAAAVAIDPRPLVEVARAAVLLGEVNSTRYTFSTIVGGAWTLFYEAFFYSLLFVGMVLKRSWIAPATLGALAAIGLVWPSILTNPLLFEFVLGMGLYRYRHHARWWMLPVGLLSVTGFPPFEARGLVWGPSALLIVAGVLALEGRLPRSNVLALLGAASYSIYITHVTLFRAFDGFSVTEAIGVGFVAGLVVHIVVEKPLGESLKRVALPRRARVGVSQNGCKPLTHIER